MNEDEIVEACLASSSQISQNDSSDDEIVEDVTCPNHFESVEMLEKLITYFERQDDTASNELLTLKCLRARAARKHFSKLKQKNIRDFFKLIFYCYILYIRCTV